MSETRNIEPLAVSAAEAAQMLGVSKPTIYDLANSDGFTASFKIGHRILFSVEGLREWVRRQTKEGNL